MTRFHAVMLDETRQEFGVDVEAETREDAHKSLEEDYPESSVVQLESPEDTASREKIMYDHLARGGDYDDEGRPIGGQDDDEDEDEDDWDSGFPDDDSDSDE